MSSSHGASYREDKSTFWKMNSKNVPGSIKPVYGAQHPPKQEAPSSQPSTPKRINPKKHDSFLDFEANTNDAWDDGDDDLISMSTFQMSKKDVHTTAMQVLNNHSQNTQKLDELGEMNNADHGEPDNNHQLINKPNKSPPLLTPGSGGPGIGVRLRPTRATSVPLSSMPIPDREASKSEKFKAVLASPNIDLAQFRKMSWSGIPRQYRPVTWRILSGYLPPNEDRRELTLQRKREEYFNFISRYYDTRHQDINSETFRQIHIDIPRMSPLMAMFQQTLVQEMFERILFIWAIRHPASGYVQGINDLVIPFFVTYLSEYVAEETPLDDYNMSLLPEEKRNRIEADSFWCFSKLMDSIQDNYTFAQPGIQAKVNALKDIISRVDNPLHRHLENQHVEYLQFTFRWMNNLLMREIPLHCTIRLWDSYLAESSEFAGLHLYVCAALLLNFSEDLLRERDFQGLMLLLQNLPTHHWVNDEISMLLAEAYKLKYMYADAPKHLTQKT